MRAVGDPITSHLVNMMIHRLLRRYHIHKDRPVVDLDLLFFVQVVIDTLSDHKVLRRILNGEVVGALYDDDLLRSLCE